MPYDWTKPAETLDGIKERILVAMKVEEDWYAKARCWHSIYSRGIRVLAIILFSIGILLPILNLDIVTIKTKPLNFGYICLAVGGLLLLLDKYLGISSGYVRFYIAELDIKKNTHEFTSNWDIETAKATTPMTIENIVNLLNIIKQFKQAVFTTIQVETGAWSTEFQTQTGELYELFKQKQSEAIKPVDIMVTVENYTSYSDIGVGIDNEAILKLNGETTLIFRNVSLQPHSIKIRALNSQNQVISFSKNVDVVAGKNADVTLTLP
jgi:hypothetical protein